jgi:hypothetical protein
MFAIGVTNLVQVPHPAWYWVVGQIAFLAGGLLGGIIARRTAVRPIAPSFPGGADV